MNPNPSSTDNSFPDDWTAVANSDDLGEGKAIERTLAGMLVAIFRHQGQLYAIEGLCAHHGGPLSEGFVAEGCVTCPWHGWQYRLCDGTQTTSGEKLIQSFEVREADGIIELRSTRGH